ncbi:MAG: transporter substrate-binding domain-containing protein [Alphaproteobacteria bacterium]|nr:transporter substrate-binding domain-containing protein [Alphaproteobacteria bacterium]
MPNKLGHYIAVIIVAALTALAVHALAPQSSGNAKPESASEQPAFERMMQSNVLRCAYIVLPPSFSKDPNTGQYSGVAYDLTEEIAKSLNLKVEWVEEVNFANLAEGLKTQRYDAVCFPLYLGNISMARVVEYTTPVYYTGTGVYVRADDHRFDNNLTAINSPDVTVVTIDAEMSQFIRAETFPQAKDFSLPQNVELAQTLEAVVTKKADVAFFDQSNFSVYLASGNQSPPVRDLAIGNPLRLHALGLVVNKGEAKLVSMLNVVLHEMGYAGRIDAILKKHETAPGQFLRTAKPYAQPAAR